MTSLPSSATVRRLLAAAALATSVLAAAPLAATTYIVELSEPPAAVAAARAAAAGSPWTAAAVEAYREQLRGRQEILLGKLRDKGIGFTVATAAVGGFDRSVTPVEYRYTLVYNGIALDLSPAAVAAVAATPGVKAVHPNAVRRPLLDRAVRYVGAPSVYGPTAELSAYDDARDGFEGQGVTVAVIDTGIEWSHEMFGGDPTPPRHGLLPPVAAVGSNQKVVYYLPLLDNVIDDFGHGTHVAADIAGYRGFSPGADGLPNTADDLPIHGIAPQAKLMGYKVCSGPGSAAGVFGCLGTSILLAIEDAVSPRTLTGFPKPVADVINLSLGGEGGPDDSEAVAASNAALLGTIVVAAAGNDGPGLSTLGSPAAGKHVIAVGASNDPGVFANRLDVVGLPGAPRMAAIWAPDSNLRSNIATAVTGRYVFAGWADTPDQVPATVLGNICLVERGSTATAGDQGTGLFALKALNCEAKGAIATVIFNDVPGPLEAVLAPSTRPVFTLSQADGRYLRDTLGFDLTGLSNRAITITPPDPSMFAPQMAGFSSRGPVKGLGQVKPDVVAPGVDVLSATTPVGVPVLSMASATRYTGANGTSFASPIVAGVATLLRQAHRDWSVDQIRAALVNYATNLRSPAGTPKADGPGADSVTEQGGGLVDVPAAVRAKALLGVAGDGVVEPALLPSWSFGRLPVVNTRVAHSERVNVHLVDVSGEGGTYDLQIADNRALTVPGVSISVSPTRLGVPAGGDVEATVTITIDGDVLRTVPAEDLQWYLTATRTDGGGSLRMPFFLRPIASQPAGAIGEANATYEGTVLAGDTGAQLGESVTYVDVPFTVGEATYGVEASLDSSLNLAPGTYPDLDFLLLDPAGDELASSASEGLPENLEALTLGPGTYTYRVVGWLNGPSPFTITSKQRLGGQPANLLPIYGEYAAQDGTQVDFDGRFFLNWQPVGGETGFEIERSTDGGQTWTVVASPPAGNTAWAFLDQPAGTLRFRLRGIFPGRIGSFVSAPGSPQSIVVDPRLQEEITTVVKTTMANVDFSNGTFALDLRMTNQSANAYVPFVDLQVVSISSASGTVKVSNADNGGDGRSLATAALFGYSRQLGADETFSAGETSATRRLAFADPAAELFTFEVRVTAYRRTAGGASAGAAGAPAGTGPAPAASPAGQPRLLTLLKFTVNPLTRSVLVSVVTDRL